MSGGATDNLSVGGIIAKITPGDPFQKLDCVVQFTMGQVLG